MLRCLRLCGEAAEAGVGEDGHCEGERAEDGRDDGGADVRGGVAADALEEAQTEEDGEYGGGRAGDQRDCDAAPARGAQEIAGRAGAPDDGFARLEVARPEIG